MHASSRLEIEREALRTNYDFIRKFISEEVNLSSVVKGNAYGHGIELFVPLAESLGIRHFSVFSADEAYRVLQCLQHQSTIMIMGDLPEESMTWAIENDIEFFVFEEGRLHQALIVAQDVGKPAKIHVEVETGMNRTGFSKPDWKKVSQYLRAYPEYLIFQGLCTHFAGAESIANYVRVQNQKKVYKEALRYFNKRGLSPKIRHTCCSAAAMRHPDMHYDMVRIGIMQFGFWPSREVLIEYLKEKTEKIDPLKRLISWRSRVMSIKEIDTGEFIGYGTTYLAHRPMRIAMVPIGYAHGFSRSLSNQGRVILHGMRVSVVGMVNMNCIAIDISELPHVKRGDEVILIGKQGEHEISVASFGELSDQLNYELLTRLPHNIPRVVAHGPNSLF